ncbi:Fis family transcriptional regulator [Bacillaceae bacterium SAOS 7]|nr:Fis family transcriptional regulator [Bacillaceae bacterium SAOS 7]
MMIFFIGKERVKMETVAQDSSVIVTFFLTSTYKINHISGNLNNVLQLNVEKIITIGMKITDIDWSGIFRVPPNFNEDTQILYTLNSQKILISFLKICEENDLEFIVSMLNISESINILEQNLHIKNAESIDTPIRSEKMKAIYQTINQIAEVNSTVLLLGESGVGKNFIAKKVHRLSNRAHQPFISVNCGAIPEHLIESELFGYEPGAFTGGNRLGKKGLFEAANSGTVFLDEVAELPYSMQSKLLDVLQEKQIRRVGSIESKRIDIRIIAATNKDLFQLVEEKKFREDLFYRLNVVPLFIPPLRERTEEIPELVSVFLEKFNEKYDRNVQFSKQFIDSLTKSKLPGNIRELQNIVERAVVTNSSILKVSQTESKSENVIVVRGMYPLKQAKKIVEEQLIRRAYAEYGSTYKAAAALKVDQSTISKK